jgi:xanthine dehydrogenase accessory factor
MLDRSRDYADCLADPGRWAIATIVEVSGSVPRPAGTSMAVRDDGRTIGSVSGGCVEGAVVDAALNCLANGEVELHSFGYADDDGISIGLMCGGDVRVLVQPLRTLPARTLRTLEIAWRGASHEGRTVGPASPDAGSDAGSATRAVQAGRAPLRLVRDLPLQDAARNGGEVPSGRTDDADSSFRTDDLLPKGSAAAPALRADAVCSAFEGSDLPADVVFAAGSAAPRVHAALDLGGAHVVEVADRSQPECPVVRRLLVESAAAPARLVIYGANDFSAALAQAAAVLGRHVTVCDARPVFATRARHPGAHEVVLERPGEHFAAERAAGRIDARTAVVVLTHDPRFDLPVLEQALPAGLAYVGAMGSRVTHEKRMQELRAAGLAEEHLDRLHSPIGLDIGARTPAEVAVSILAELVLAESAARAGVERAAPRKLRDTTGDVHDPGRTCGAEPRLLTTLEAVAWT